MILGQVGIPAKWEAILPTLTLSNGQVRLFTSENAANPQTFLGPSCYAPPGLFDPFGWRPRIYLKFNIGGEMNNFEGGVLVNGRFYPSQLSDCVGVAGGFAPTAEYATLVFMYDNYNDLLQAYWDPDGPTHWYYYQPMPTPYYRGD